MTRRGDLVRAAESLIRAELESGQGRKKLSATQLSQLIHVCQKATCVEEVVLYLKYQGGRRDAGVSMDFVRRTLATAEKMLAGDDALANWRHFAVYLKRSFVYESAVRS